MSSEVKLSTRHALRVLRPGPFRRYIIGSAISDTGTWMQVMAQGYVMSTLTDKALLLGLANLAAGLPMLLLTMAGGSAADRFDKRKILLATQYAQIALAISIGFLIMSGKIQIWHILAFVDVLGISNLFDKPSLAMIGLIAATTVFIFPIITVMMPLYVRLVLGLGADRLGFLMGASAVGSVIGAIFLISIPRRKRVPFMMVNVGIVACAIF